MKRMTQFGCMTVALLFFACSGPQVGGGQCDYSACPPPAWKDNPPQLSSVGVSGGINARIKRKAAVANARNNMAAEMGSWVVGMVETSFEQVMGPDGGMTGHDFAQGIEKNVWKQYLSGTHPKHFWTDCCTGEMYTLVVIDVEGLAVAAAKAARQHAEKILPDARKKHKELDTKLQQNIRNTFGK